MRPSLNVDKCIPSRRDDAATIKIDWEGNVPSSVHLGHTLAEISHRVSQKAAVLSTDHQYLGRDRLPGPFEGIATCDRSSPTECDRSEVVSPLVVIPIGNHSIKPTTTPSVKRNT